jgi:hypothetical protein
MSLNFQERSAETRHIEVEGVERVKTVGSYKREVDLRSEGKAADQKYCPA